jgi:hypothetical protein
MSTGARSRRRLLTQPQARVPWLVWGAILQVLGLGSIAVVMWRNIRQQGIASQVTAEMVKLAWHSALHTRFGVLVLIAASVLYAAGSVAMARPYISSPAALFLAIPIAAVAGKLTLGVLVMILWVLLLIAENNSSVSFPSFCGSRRRRPPR